jgi:DNA-binding PadR family transcriptional regulator
MGRRGGHWQSWGPGPGWAHTGHGGPPPWVAGLFGMGEAPRRSRPRARRGDVRSAILDVLQAAARAEEPINGYQVIQQIGERSDYVWRPSPGSVYPTIQQLQDEGLVEADDEHGRRTIRLTAEGVRYCEEHADDLAAVLAPFERGERGRREERDGADFSDLKPEIGQVMGAVWQIVTSGSDQQRRAAVDILADTRRRLYGVLADGHDQEAEA